MSGYTKVMRVIKLDGGDYEVRKNLFDALNSLRRETEPWILWMHSASILINPKRNAAKSWGFDLDFSRVIV